MDAEGLAGFDWIFAHWSNLVVSTLIGIAPVTEAIGSASRALVTPAMFLAVTLLLLALLRGQFAALGERAAVALIVMWGLQPTTLQFPGRASIEVLRIQAVLAQAGGVLQGVYSSALSKALAENSAGGRIIPTQAALDDAVERAVSAFGDSDLGALIRDYNQRCGPRPGEVNHADVRAWQSIGLLGGGGLGVPDDTISNMNQLRELAGGAVDLLASVVGIDSNLGDIGQAFNLSSLNWNREKGLQALGSQKVPDAFNQEQRRYQLPGQGYWEGLFSGQNQQRVDYLRVSEAPVEARHGPNVLVREHEDPYMDRQFVPTNCMEAFHIAQYGGEQAYRALEKLGKEKAPATLDATSGTVGTVVAWSRLMGRLGDGEQGSSATGAAIGAATGAFQVLKNYKQWLDLQVLMPMALTLAGAGFAITLVLAPVFVLVAIVAGMRVITVLVSTLAFCTFFTIFCQALAVGASLLYASVVFGQSAAASGWTGDGAEWEMLRVGLSAVCGMLLVGAVWFSSRLTGTTIGGLTAAARNSIGTPTEAAKMAAATVAMAAGISRIARAVRGPDKSSETTSELSRQAVQKRISQEASRSFPVKDSVPPTGGDGSTRTGQERAGRTINLNPPRPQPPKGED
ncbi:hypothetical protein E8F11_10470 [Pseudomonas sp. BN417]|uniref:hypothetical protein n=1 Tax=Pseudomonas sp. BN417 TaxID=2567890 RepID=UPI0024540D6E|nr:hypothetical protein [Pseudomonas sp. BN417]MDH4555596.1 hypothetical protein [Pseudomonas sp. BN417]